MRTLTYTHMWTHNQSHIPSSGQLSKRKWYSKAQYCAKPERTSEKDKMRECEKCVWKSELEESACQRSERARETHRERERAWDRGEREIERAGQRQRDRETERENGRERESAHIWYSEGENAEEWAKTHMFQNARNTYVSKRKSVWKTYICHVCASDLFRGTNQHFKPGSRACIRSPAGGGYNFDDTIRVCCTCDFLNVLQWVTKLLDGRLKCHGLYTLKHTHTHTHRHRHRHRHTRTQTHKHA